MSEDEKKKTQSILLSLLCFIFVEKCFSLSGLYVQKLRKSYELP